MLLGGIERNDERIGPREPGEHLPAAGHAGHRVGERARYLVQETGFYQQLALRFRLLAQDLVDQVLTDAARIERQLGDEIGGILSPLHPHGGQLHASRPSLGPRGQDAGIPVLEGNPVGTQYLGDLSIVHGQVRRAQLVHLAGQPVSVQRQQGVAARGQDQPQAGMPAANQAVQAGQDLGVNEHVRVIDDHDERVRRLGYPAEQRLDQVDACRPRPLHGRTGDRHRGCRAARSRAGARTGAAPRRQASGSARQPGHRRGAPSRRAEPSCRPPDRQTAGSEAGRRRCQGERAGEDE